MTNLLTQLEEALKSDTQDGKWVVQKDGKTIVDRRFVVARCEAKYPRCFNDAKYISLCNPSNVAKLLRVVRAADETYRDLIDFIKAHNQFTENTGDDIVIDENWPHWRLGQALQALDEPKQEPSEVEAE